MKAVVRRRFSG